jgi:hypothetical protein
MPYVSTPRGRGLSYLARRHSFKRFFIFVRIEMKLSEYGKRQIEETEKTISPNFQPPFKSFFDEINRDNDFEDPDFPDVDFDEDDDENYEDDDENYEDDDENY